MADPIPTLEPVAPPGNSSWLTRGFLPLFVVSLLVSVLLPWALWLSMRPPELTPFEQTEQALEWLHEGHNRPAYELAMRLLQKGINEPDIGGALEYIVGVAHFRKAERVNEQAETQSYVITHPIYELAQRYLEQARLKTFKSELKPEWAYVLGSCYYELNQLYPARDYLEQAYQLAPHNHAKIMLKLSDCYLDPNVLQSSLEHASSLAEAQQKRQSLIDRVLTIVQDEAAFDALNEREQFELLVQLASLQTQQHQPEAVAETFSQIQQRKADADLQEELKKYLSDAERLLRAQLYLQTNQNEQARQQLRGLIQDRSGLEQRSILQAHYFTGLAYAADERYDLALEHLDKPALASEYAICIPAALHAGDVARRRGLHEEALGYYLRGLAQVKSTTDFTNRWIDLTQARQLIQAAWDEWGNSGRYEHFRFATELAERVVPLFSAQDAHQLLALIARRRAELIQRETDQIRPHADAEQLQQAREHWKKAGHAYARLAASTQSSEAYSRHLWEACLLYRKGNDFQNALVMINQFIRTDPRVGLPAALILKARLLLDLDPYTPEDQLPQTIDILQRVMRDYPKDQAVYEAQWLLGQALLEHDQAAVAIETWRDLLLNSPLTPEATEWQAALFSLGQALFLTSETRPQILRTAAVDTAPPATDITVAAEHPEPYTLIDEAVHWLDEFVRRNPEHARALEARWLLAKGLRCRMQKPVERLPLAETENTRLEHLREIRTLAARSMQEFKVLGLELNEQDQKNELNAVTAQFVRDAYFEPAHIQFDLGRYDPTGDAYRKAIEFYSNAAFHFTGDPVVLLAYFRIAECYRELQADEEARRQLEQARVILQQLKDPLPQRSTNFTRQQWEALLEQSIRLYDLVLEANPAPSRN